MLKTKEMIRLKLAYIMEMRETMEEVKEGNYQVANDFMIEYDQQMTQYAIMIMENK